MAALAVGLLATLVGLLTGSGGLIIGLVVGLLLANVVFSLSEDARTAEGGAGRGGP